MGAAIVYGVKFMCCMMNVVSIVMSEAPPGGTLWWLQVWLPISCPSFTACVQIELDASVRLPHM